MKIGIRTPSLKKTLKAKTTGRIKRSLKSNVIPFYGQSGIGLIKNPTKSIKNRIYKRVTIDPLKKLRK